MIWVVADKRRPSRFHNLELIYFVFRQTIEPNNSIFPRSIYALVCECIWEKYIVAVGRVWLCITTIWFQKNLSERPIHHNNLAVHRAKRGSSPAQSGSDISEPFIVAAAAATVYYYNGDIKSYADKTA